MTAGTIRRSPCLAAAAVHDRVHAQPEFAALPRRARSSDDYARLLRRLLGLHVPIEEWLTRDDNDGLMASRKTGGVPAWSAQLRADLTWLGIDQKTIEAAPCADTFLPALDDLAAALGRAWLVEGAAQRHDWKRRFPN